MYVSLLSREISAEAHAGTGTLCKCATCKPSLPAAQTAAQPYIPLFAQTERRRAPDVVLGQGDRQHRQADDEGNVRVETVLELVPAP